MGENTLYDTYLNVVWDVYTHACYRDCKYGCMNAAIAQYQYKESYGLSLVQEQIKILSWLLNAHRYHTTVKSNIISQTIVKHLYAIY